MQSKNKKTFRIIAECVSLAVMVIFFLTSCASAPKEVLPLADAAKQAFPGLEELTDYDAEEFLDIVGVSPDDYTAFVYRTGENEIGLVAREIILVRAKDSAALARVRDALIAYRARRQKETVSYAPDIYAMLEKSDVSVKGNTAALIISENSQSETAAFMAKE